MQEYRYLDNQKFSKLDISRHFSTFLDISRHFSTRRKRTKNVKVADGGCSGEQDVVILHN